MDAKGVFLFFHCALVGVPKSFASLSLFLCELSIDTCFFFCDFLDAADIACQRSMFPGGATREVLLSGEPIRGYQERNPE
ncbi:hypothetical protein [uncultured Brevibacillus sp.]|uniref:hypothetical protein n=1 Tax=uncultured Brevibacillus sp. TaxID=169970 RepID=UPI002595668A|nr:hypothetical protein [uncultured Brevibacillus sp.]